MSIIRRGILNSMEMKIENADEDESAGSCDKIRIHIKVLNAFN